VDLSPQMILASQCKVRSFRPGDEHHVWRLYNEGLLVHCHAMVLG
jgi:hypothetical protein